MWTLLFWLTGWFVCSIILGLLLGRALRPVPARVRRYD